MKNRNIEALRRQAESGFSSYTGDNDKRFLGVQSGFGGMGGGEAVINNEPFAKEIIFDIQNTDNCYDLAAPLFSAYENIAVPFNGVQDSYYTENTAQSAKGIIVTPRYFSDAYIKEMIKGQPFVIAGYRYEFADSTQLAHDWLIRKAKGQKSNLEYETPSIRLGLEQNIATTLENPGFTLLVDGSTTLLVKVGAGKTIRLIFKVATQAEIANVLQGAPAVNKYGNQYAAGVKPRMW